MPSAGKARKGLIVSALGLVITTVWFALEHDPVIGLAAVGAGVLVWSWTKRLLRPEPALVLSSEGIRVLDRGFVPWAELESLEVFRISGRFLGFEVTNPASVWLPSSPIVRLWRAFDRVVERVPLSITENLIEGTFEDVVPLILQWKSVPVSWNG